MTYVTQYQQYVQKHTLKPVNLFMILLLFKSRCRVIGQMLLLYLNCLCFVSVLYIQIQIKLFLTLSFKIKLTLN